MAEAVRWVVILGLFVVIGCAGSSSEQRDAARAEKPLTDADPVSASMAASPARLRAGDRCTVSIVLDVTPAYEIQTLHAAPPAVATQLALKLPSGFRAIGEWKAPEPTRSPSPDGHPVHVGRCTFTRELQVEQAVEPTEHGLECSIRYQACNERLCLPPNEFKVVVTVRAEAGHR